ncbi:MAG TPA: tetratricopeptide repeat protein [Tenuifilaceae bacterium]|nr:tetratricopeptide repeat protein [Tenuifilaceae bacterium]
MLKQRLHITILTLCLVSATAFSQNAEKVYQNRIDSLENVLKKTEKENMARVLLQIAKNYLSLADYNEDTPLDTYNKAITFTDSGFKAAAETNNNFYKGYALYLKGQALGIISEYAESPESLDESIDILNQSISYLSKTDSIAELVESYNKLIVAHQYKNEYDKAIEIANKALSLDIESSKRPGVICDIYYLKGMTYVYQNDYTKSIETLLTLKEYAAAHKDTTYISRGLNTLGYIEFYRGNYSQSLEYFVEALKISERLKLSPIESVRNAAANEAAIRKVNIGGILKELKQLDEALRYYNEALAYHQQTPDKPESKEASAQIFNNIGVLFEEKKDFDKAESYYKQSLKLKQELNDTTGIVSNLINLGSVYTANKELSAALRSYQEALRICRRLDDKRRIALITNNIGDVYSLQNRNEEALEYYFSSLEQSRNIGLKEIIKLNYEGISKSYEKLGKFDKALAYYKEFGSVKDSLLNEGNLEAIAEIQTKYETEKKEQQLQILTKDQALKDETIKRNRVEKLAMGIGITLVLFFAAYVVIQLQEKKRKNTLLAEQNAEIQMQKEEIETQRDEIMIQRDLLAKQKQEITDSIYYARRIQTAILPSDVLAQDILPNSFILFKPRDIVSGDFYWMTKRDNKAIVVCADCTGHGVPGAFMSMLGVAFLNEIVANIPELKANSILNSLREFVKTTLDQTGKKDEAKDGMDIALCIIEKDTQTIQFAGAYNPLIYFRNGELFEVKADKMPIGIHIKDQEPFTNNVIEYQQGDTFYIFSDGYVSQFGGDDGKKFMSKPFKNLLGTIQDKDMDEQLKVIDKALVDWQGNTDQVDDISVIGFRL